MSKKSKILILACLIGIPGSIILLNVWFDITNPAREISIFVNYEDGTVFGNDYIVEGLDWEVLDGLNSVIMSGTTGTDGMVSFFLTETYDLTGLGIHLDVEWQGVTEQVINMIPGSYELELGLFHVDSSVKWAHDGTLIPEGTPYELFFNGESLINKTLTGLSVLQQYYLVDGEYSVSSDAFNTVSFNITTLHPSDTYNTDILVSAEGVLNSRIYFEPRPTLLLTGSSKSYLFLR